MIFLRNNNWTKVGEAKPDDLRLLAPRLVEGTPYVFRVMAVNQEGQSDALDEGKEIVPVAPPITFLITNSIF